MACVLNPEKQREKMMIKKILAASIFTGLFACQSVLADEWKYAMEESLTEVQGVYATKFKEYIEANSDLISFIM